MFNFSFISEFDPLPMGAELKGLLPNVDLLEKRVLEKISHTMLAQGGFENMSLNSFFLLQICEK